ncbi:MAG TPA: GDSL-type esterase/lipase family protein [Solirubrobacterales bacterium]|nr:GDSL-type esterase/lipase family protein [Solirubrobacterales bacterium]
MLTKVALLAAAAVVSIGDSFISGEGGGDYGDSGACHRSVSAPIRSARLPAAEAVNLACSGARTRNLWPAEWGGERLRGEPPQADRLAALARTRPVRLIVVTAGANDIGFGRIVARCALDWARSSVRHRRLCRHRAEAELAAKLPAMRRDLTTALRGIRSTMAAAGRPRAGYRLVVAGYASPFPEGRFIRYPERGWSRLREGGCPVWNADADWAVRRATPQIDAAMQAAAQATGAEYLDLEHALDGHQLCDRRAAVEWVRPLRFAPWALRESLHPDARGQRAIGACIALHYARPRGDYACRSPVGGADADGTRLERLG